MFPSTGWPHPSSELRLAPPLPFTHSAALRALAHRVLTPEELTRRAGFLRAADADLWTSARLLLRLSLALHIPIAASDIRIAEGAFRRPELASPNPAQLRFNVSHTQALVAVALAWDDPIGVDIEFLDRKLSADLCARVFTPEEISEDRSTGLPFAHHFLRRWTAKEALAKSTGEGLSTDWLAFSVCGLDEGARRRVLSKTKAASPYSGLHLHPLPCPRSHLGAIASRSPAPPRLLAPPWPWHSRISCIEPKAPASRFAGRT